MTAAPVAQDALLDIVSDVLHRHARLARQAMRLRAKFEGWLKWEIVESILASGERGPWGPVAVERRLQGEEGAKAVDLVLTYEGTECYVELKTANTNWRCSDCENLTRPITMNVDGVIADVRSLQDVVPPETAIGLAAFTLFPVPIPHATEFGQLEDNWDSTKVGGHVSRILREAWLTRDDLRYREIDVGLETCRILAFCVRV